MVDLSLHAQLSLICYMITNPIICRLITISEITPHPAYPSTPLTSHGLRVLSLLLPLLTAQNPRESVASSRRRARSDLSTEYHLRLP